MQSPSKSLILNLQCREGVLHTLHWNHTPEIFLNYRFQDSNLTHPDLTSLCKAWAYEFLNSIPGDSDIHWGLRITSLEIPIEWFESSCMPAKLLQSCPTLCNPKDCSPPGSSVLEILQARILEWVAMTSSSGSS